jgi:chromosome partitioning protein
MKILSVANQKGGVGKTTLVSLLIYLLSDRLKLLAVDMDPQAHLTLSLLNDIPEENTSYHLLMKGIFQPVKVQNFELIPAFIGLANAEVELASAPAREYRLRKAISKINPKYDLVIIDTPPSLSFLTLNALMASDGVLIPTETRYYGLASLKHLFRVLNELTELTEKKIEILGIVPTFYEKIVILHQDALEELRRLPYRVFKPIPKRSIFQYASIKGVNLLSKLDTETKETLEEIKKEVLKWLNLS